MEKAFINSSYYKGLHDDIAHDYRRIGHALDNYGVDMSKGLREALEGLQRATEAVLKQMEAERG
ncbi:MAG: hypothetical protein Q4E24_10260 [bacterium]|nr:hypothetical protein [bacterium]